MEVNEYFAKLLIFVYVLFTVALSWEKLLPGAAGTLSSYYCRKDNE